MRRFARGEEAVAHHRVPARQPAPRGRAGPQRGLAQPVGDAPMGGEPGQGVGMGGAGARMASGTGSSACKVERTLSPVSDLGGGARLVGLDQAAELPGEDVAAGDRQPALRGRHRGGAVKNIFLEPGAVEPPGNHPGTPRRRSECFQRRRRARHREMVVQPPGASPSATRVVLGRRPRWRGAGSGDGAAGPREAVGSRAVGGASSHGVR